MPVTTRSQHASLGGRPDELVDLEGTNNLPKTRKAGARGKKASIKSKKSTPHKQALQSWKEFVMSWKGAVVAVGIVMTLMGYWIISYVATNSAKLPKDPPLNSKLYL